MSLRGEEGREGGSVGTRRGKVCIDGSSLPMDRYLWEKVKIGRECKEKGYRGLH